MAKHPLKFYQVALNCTHPLRYEIFFHEDHEHYFRPFIQILLKNTMCSVLTHVPSFRPGFLEIRFFLFCFVFGVILLTNLTNKTEITDG